MVSKMVSDRQKVADDATAWSTARTASIAQGIMARLGAAADPTALMAAVAGAVATDIGELVKQDELHTLEGQDDAKPRSERDALSRKVAMTLSELRAGLEVNHGAASLALLGLTEAVYKDAVHVERVGRRVCVAASAPDFALPEPKRKGNTVAMAAFLEELNPSVEQLKLALDAVNTEEAELAVTQSAKYKAFDKFNETFATFLDVMSALARAAGMPEVADDLPTLTRGGRSSTAAAQVTPVAVPDVAPGATTTTPT